MKSLLESSSKKADEAEENILMNLLCEANALRRRAADKQSKVNELNILIAEAEWVLNVFF